jgi:rhomboid protease GluP
MNPASANAATTDLEAAIDGEAAPAEASANATVAGAEDKPVPLWAYPATYLLIAINLVVFAAMARHTPLAGYWRHHVWSEMFTTMFDANRVVQFGGSEASLVLGGEWWRLVTATFVHVNVLHILINLWCLWNLGFFGEPLLGRRGFVAVYLLTGVAGNMLSLAWSMFVTHTDSIVAGASGAVFGVAGILIILLSNRGLKVPWEELRSLRLQVIFFALVNIAFGETPRLLPYLSAETLAKLHIDPVTMPRVDNSAHIGGFLAGLALGLPLFSKMTSGRVSYRQRQRLTFGAAAFALVLVGYALASAQP